MGDSRIDHSVTYTQQFFDKSRYLNITCVFFPFRVRTSAVLTIRRKGEESQKSLGWWKQLYAYRRRKSFSEFNILRSSSLPRHILIFKLPVIFKFYFIFQPCEWWMKNASRNVDSLLSSFDYYFYPSILIFPSSRVPRECLSSRYHGRMTPLSMTRSGVEANDGLQK